MSIIRIKKRETPFVQIDKRPIEDVRLSWKAKGLLAYLLSKPDDWKIRMSDLEKRSKDGRASCRSGLQELEAKGYILKRRLRDAKGVYTEMEYLVFETPRLVDQVELSSISLDTSKSGKSTYGKSISGKSTCGESPATNNHFTNNHPSNNEVEAAENYLGVPIPKALQVEGFRKTYTEWWKYLQVQWNREPNTHTIKAQFQQLVELREQDHDPMKVISQSIRHINKSFYPIRSGFSREERGRFASEGLPNAGAYKEYDG